MVDELGSNHAGQGFTGILHSKVVVFTRMYLQSEVSDEAPGEVLINQRPSTIDIPVEDAVGCVIDQNIPFSSDRKYRDLCHAEP